MTDSTTKPVSLNRQIEFIRRMKTATELHSKAANACALANHAAGLAQTTKECRDESFAARDREEAKAREAETHVRLFGAILDTLQRVAAGEA